uniref:Uncharacterized protein n=1 Tax=Anguilla anguilla TaxID=7936 RepID=A0A0E9VJE4_ANGAN
MKYLIFHIKYLILFLFYLTDILFPLTKWYNTILMNS